MLTREIAEGLTNELTSDYLQLSLSRKMLGLLEEPEFEWLAKGPKYRDCGGPVVKAAIANTGLEADIWEGLKNLAMIGLYPLGLPEIWEYYAHITAIKVDESGRTSLFAPAKSYAWAKERYSRAVLISIMFPLAEEPLRDFADLMDQGRRGPVDYYNKWWTLMNLLLERASSWAWSVFDRKRTSRTGGSSRRSKFSTNVFRSDSFKRYGEPKYLAYAVIFLCSDQNNYITGQCINIDGGVMLGKGLSFRHY